MKNTTLFCVLGWEERFFESMYHILDNNKIYNVCLFCFTDYLQMNNMTENLQKIRTILQTKSISLEMIELEYGNSIKNWHILNDFFMGVNFENVILNITTIPRETIWTLLFFLHNKNSDIAYVYYKPLFYDNSEGGLTKNHKIPRLLFKHSGVFDIDKKLVIFIITGFDKNRVDVLIEYYEPRKIVYLSQKGEQFENMKRNFGNLPQTTYENIEVENIEVDSYNIEETFQQLDLLIEEHGDYNIIISSLGPKTSAISTYLAYLKNSDVALSYVSAREFSGEYSFGFDNNPVLGKIK